MGAKKRKNKLPTRMLILWSQSEQVRLVEAVERLSSLVNDLETLLQEPKRRAEAAAATRKARITAAVLEAAAKEDANVPADSARGGTTAADDAGF